MRGKPDADVEPGQPEQTADARREPRVGARQGRPARFIEPAEHHHIGMLEPRFEQAPDAKARVAAIRPPHGCGLEQLAQQRDALAGLDAECGGGGGLFERFEQSGGGTAFGTGPGGWPSDGGSGDAQGGSEAGERGFRGERRGRGFYSGSNCGPRLGALVGELFVEASETGARAWAAEATVEGSDVAQPVCPLVPLPTHTRMLEQGEQRDRGKLLLGERNQRQQQRSRSGLREGAPGAVVGGDAPARQLRRDPGGKRAVGGNQRRGLPGDFERLAQGQRDRLCLRGGVGQLNAADSGEAALARRKLAPFVREFRRGERVGDGAPAHRW